MTASADNELRAGPSEWRHHPRESDRVAAT